MKAEEMGEIEKRHEEEISKLTETFRRSYSDYQEFLKRVSADPRGCFI